MASLRLTVVLILTVILLQDSSCLTQSQLNYLKEKLNERFYQQQFLSQKSEADYSEYMWDEARDSKIEEETNEIEAGGTHLINVDIKMPNVQPTHENEYFCHSLAMPRDRSVFIVGYEPKTAKGTAHHMLLYGCSNPGSRNGSWNCGEMANNNDGPVCEGDARILYAWAMDAPPLELHKDVGFEVGGDTGVNYLVLQVHYGEIEDKIKKHFTDNSGITLKVTDQRRKLTAGVYLLGSEGRIPAHSTVHMDSACSYDHPQVLHPFAFRVHTHKLGKVVAAYRIRNQLWTIIGKQDPQKPQMFYPIDKNITIEQGDILAARCTMVNEMDKTVFTGPTSEDEMCNFYMMYYTTGSLPNIESCYRGKKFHWSNYFDNIPTDASIVPDSNIEEN